MGKRARKAQQTAAMGAPPTPSWLARHADWFVALVLLVAAGSFYRHWERPQLTDSVYLVLGSEVLWRDGTFALDRYLAAEQAAAAKVPANAKKADQHAEPGYPYQIQVLPRDAHNPSKPRFFMWYPRLPAVLLAPLMPVLHAQGLSAIAADGTFDLAAETAMQLRLAAWLCALCVALAYLLNRCFLPIHFSILLAVAVGVATPLWSTGSRALWSHDFGLVFGLGLCLHLARTALAGVLPKPWLVGSLCALLYLCRPAFAVEILATMGYVLVVNRRRALQTAAVGALWAVSFLVWSHSIDGDWLPSYYRHTKLAPGHFWAGFYGSLLSPGRGLLVYSPLLLPVAAVLAGLRRQLPTGRLAAMAVAVAVGHAAMLGLYPSWWGGHSFGARLMLDTLPWTTLLCAIAVAAILDLPFVQLRLRQGFWLAAGLALASGSWIHWRGVTDPRTFRWNSWPAELTAHDRRFFDWRLPQFMAGLAAQPLPQPVPPLPGGHQLAVGQAANDLYLLEGWGDPEGAFRWSDGDHARLAWQSTEPPRQIGVLLRPYLDLRPQGRGPKQQQLRVLVNGQLALATVLVKPGSQWLTVPVPAAVVGNEMVLTLATPDAVAPKSVGDGGDTRRLGVAVAAVKWVGR